MLWNAFTLDNVGTAVACEKFTTYRLVQLRNIPSPIKDERLDKSTEVKEVQSLKVADGKLPAFVKFGKETEVKEVHL